MQAKRCHCASPFLAESVARTRTCRQASRSTAVKATKKYQHQLFTDRLELPQQNKILFAIVELLFGVKPLWEAAKKEAKEKIAKRGAAIGVDFEGEVECIKSLASSWETEMSRVAHDALQYPDYYLQPFHAYSQGNLCWEAAFEVPTAAKLVHAPVMDPENKDMDPEGDAKLRGSYSKKLRLFMAEIRSRPVTDVLDIGCATGLSSMELQANFQGARVLGVDLSPYFLAVGRIQQRQRPKILVTRLLLKVLATHLQKRQHKEEQIELRHAAAEATGLADASFDLVSICLVLHELPTRATEAIAREAFRLLRPGGTLGIMEMNPSSPAFRRIFGNPFAYVPFKATEPWLVEYITTDLLGILRDVGFTVIKQEPSTPRHFTLAAKKPEQ